MKKWGFIGIKQKRGYAAGTVVYDSRSLELLKGMLGIPHRHISDKADDWFSEYLGRNTDGS